ncbi:integrase arm-type DNA-binding domain-containing protein [Phaeobacter inhibens]|uniref:site-specific integrase n=1 Tax=Phaeobacter inhibens TaxID=221822 RepID=UPI0021A6DE64|nr:site-specific integrase [Phaeobacter inhibens]UWS03123.1 integrase arm-type DNA-binding domain-containing protein [Phaeobacter inhibens]
MTDKVKLTKRAVDALKPSEKRFTAWDSEISGFGVRVTPSGRKTYVLKYRVGGGRSGRVRWAMIGIHGTLTPDQARETARRWASDVAAGGDPASAKSEWRNAPTVSDLLDRYLEEHVNRKNKASSARNVRMTIENIIRPSLGRLKVCDVTLNDVSRLHTHHADTPYMANRTLAALSKAFALAEVWGMRPDGSNPCKKVERFKEQSRERFLSGAEFRRLGEVLAQAERDPLRISGTEGKERLTQVNPQAIRAIRLLVFTGARVGEILGLRWEHIDKSNGRANLPDSKTGKKTIQLPAPALEVLAAAERPEDGKGYVIRGGDGSDPEVPLVNIKGPWGAIRQAAGLDDVRPHDLRHAFASIAVAGGLSLPMIGALLGHRETRTTQRYAHLSDDPQRAAADLIAGRISDAMRGPESGAEVVPLRKKSP